MVCPHCGHDNAAGRKFCRSCAKPLAPESAVVKPTVPPIVIPSSRSPLPSSSPSSPRSTPDVNKMAIASLSLSFLAFFVPFGIASVVMGHMSRAQIARSNGRQTGAWLAFAGLIISYFQFIVVGLLCIGLIGFWRQMNQNLDRDPYVRTALMQRVMNGDPSHPSAADAGKHRQDLVDALRLIRARQDEYRTNHPEGYACSMNDLYSGDEELGLKVLASRYEIQLLCRRVNDDGYVAKAVPHTDSNPPDSPIYCLDQTKIIRKYFGSEHANDVTVKTSYRHESCPLDGEPVD